MPIFGAARTIPFFQQKNDGMLLRAQAQASSLSVDLSSMADAVHANDSYGIGNLINHPEISHPYAPITLAAHQFPATGGTGIARQGKN
jgi:hypothetical protein